jgi:nitric oxide reductase activation protein
MRHETDFDNDATSINVKNTVAGPPEPLPHDHHDVSRHLHHHEEGELKSLGSNTFLYPEWDVFLGRYRTNWCRVVQKRASAAEALERSSLQIRYANELRRLRRVMDIPPSQAFVTERRTPNGPDVDYDAAVEAMTDFRTGGGIRDSVYQDLRRRKRDVSVLLLVVVSASTAERVEDAEPIELALSPVMSSQHKLRPPRILDIEVISSLLCTNALNAVGDSFAVWSFSGTGREQVILSEIKGFNEPLSGIVVSRAAAMKPIHATRLGAAVRHCGMILSKLQSQTKVLLVLTDGRPFDIDYGTSYG